jgi:hypothetical protein
MFMFHLQNARENQIIKIATISFDYVGNFKYLEKSYSVCGKSKSKLNLGNASYYLLHNFLSFHLLSINIKITPYKSIILSFVLWPGGQWDYILCRANIH